MIYKTSFIIIFQTHYLTALEADFSTCLCCSCEHIFASSCI